MKTIEMEIAIMKELDVRRNVIVPNVSWAFGSLHECDLLSLSKSGYATEIEIKVSKADLLKDKEKRHSHENDLISYFYFAVPEKLKEIALAEIPVRAGLYVIEEFKVLNSNKKILHVNKIRTAVKNAKSVKWSLENKLHLAHLGAMRILNLKKKILKK